MSTDEPDAEDLAEAFPHVAQLEQELKEADIDVGDIPQRKGTTRRDLLAGSAGLLGLGGLLTAGSGTAAAGDGQVGKLGTDGNRLDAEIEDLDLTDQSSTPAGPGSGQVRFYAKDGSLYYKPAGGTETEVGAGGGGSGAFTDDNGDGTYTLPNTSDGISVQDVSATVTSGGLFGPQPSRNVYDFLALGWEEISNNPLITNESGFGAIWPSVIKWPFDSRYFVYWDDHNSNIHASTADSLTGSYTDQGTVLSTGASGSWDDDHVSSAEVVYYPWDDSNPAHLFYHGADGSGTQQTGFAYGTDGLNWTKHSSNPCIQTKSGSWRDSHTGYARYVKAGSISVSFHRGKTSASGIGMSWADDSGVNFDGKDTGSPERGGDVPESPIFTTETGTWTESALLGFTPIRVGDMWYGFLAADDANNNHAIGMYTSRDLINWKAHPQNPIIDPAGSGGWNDQGVSSPSFIRDGTTLYMFVDGDDDTSNPAFSIGAYKLDLGQLEVWD